MSCKNCKHWQGARGHEWGDCYRVLADINPNILDCHQTDEYGMPTKFVEVPFDPHDIKYWRFNEKFVEEYFNAWGGELPEGVKVDARKRIEMMYDRDGGEALRKVTLHYFMTNKNFNCSQEE